MPAGIKGKVFHDLNSNGRWLAGEPGIPNNYIVLEYPDGTFSKTFTDVNGDYFFSELTLPGTHKLYNVYRDPGTVTIPPTECFFPPGLWGLTGWRRWDLNITTTQINNNTTIVDANNSGTSSTNRTYFGYDNPEQFNVPYGIVVAGNIYYIDLVNGTAKNTGISGGSLNGMGFGVLDNFVYGAMPSALSRLSADGTVVDYPDPPGAVAYNGGDTDEFGHLYVVRTGGYYCHDVNPYRSTFGRSLDSQNGFVEITDGSPALPYGPGVSVAAAEALYRYSDHRVYRPAGTIAYYMDVLTGQGGSIPITGGNATISGVGFLDNVGNGYMGGENLRLVNFSPDTAPTTVATEAFPNFGLGTGDGARNGLLPIYFAVPETVKSVSKTIAKIGDILTYTLAVTNTGNINSENITVIDTIPSGTSFVNNSLYLNGVNLTGENILPPNGFTNNIKIDVNEKATITFQVLIESLPSGSITLPNSAYLNFEFIDLQTSIPYNQNYTSNTVNTRVLDTTSEVIKSADLANVILGNTITYTITIKNNGNVDFLNTAFRDTIPNGTTFVAGSFTVDGVTIPTGNPSAVSGVNLLTIPVGVTKTITFKVAVVSVPTGTYTIPNTGRINFYIKDPGSTATLPDYKESNKVESVLKVVDLSKVKKIVNKTFTTVGNTITYTIEIPNMGNTTAKNVIITDTLSNGISYVSGSLTIDGILSTETPPSINIGDIDPNTTKTVSFVVKIN